MQNIHSAKAFSEGTKQIECEQQKQLNLENEQFIQTEELKKQTLILNEARNLTNENAAYTKQVLECTLQNQKSSTRQFLASIIIAGVALIVAILTLIK